MSYKGGKIGSISRLRESLKKGGGNSQYIKQVPANEIMIVRFLTEPDEWYGYYETYDTEIKRYYPLIEGVEKPEGARVSYRYLAAVLDVDNDQVIPLKLPKDLANRLMMRYDRFETIMDRDYELSRMGEGLDTTYDVTPGDKVKRNLSKYDVIDLDNVLTEAAGVALGVTGGDTSAPKAPSERAAAKRKVEATVESDADDDDDDEDEEPVAERRAAPAPEPVAEDDDEEFDEDDDEDEAPAPAPAEDSSDDDDDDDDDYITEEELHEMSLADLRALATTYGIDTTGMSKSAIINSLLSDD